MRLAAALLAVLLAAAPPRAAAAAAGPAALAQPHIVYGAECNAYMVRMVCSESCRCLRLLWLHTVRVG